MMVIISFRMRVPTCIVDPEGHFQPEGLKLYEKAQTRPQFQLILAFFREKKIKKRIDKRTTTEINFVAFNVTAEKVIRVTLQRRLEL